MKDYWPEFAQNGKEEITVEILLSHQASEFRQSSSESLLNSEYNLCEGGEIFQR